MVKIVNHILKSAYGDNLPRVETQRPSTTKCRFQRLLEKINELVYRIALLVKLFFKKKRALISFDQLPQDSLSDIIRPLSNLQDRIHLSKTSRQIKENLAFANRQKCFEMLGLIRACVEQEPRLHSVFPHLFEQLSSLGCSPQMLSSDLFQLSSIELNLRQSLRMIALVWGYNNPRVLKKILLKLGYLPATEKACDKRFEELDSHWEYGSLVPRLISRAIVSSCLKSIELLISFVPFSERQGRYGNLSITKTLTAGTLNAKEGRLEVNMAIMCLLRRNLESAAEKKRFTALYGKAAADALAAISPAFNSPLAVSLQNSETDRQIWQAMNCTQCQKEVRDSALPLQKRLKSFLYSPSPNSSERLSVAMQIKTESLHHIPHLLWDRQLSSPKPFLNIRASTEIKHKEQLARAQFNFVRQLSRSRDDNQTDQQNPLSEAHTFGAYEEMRSYTALGERLLSEKYQSSDSLIEALNISLFGSGSQFIALRNAVKSFLYECRKTGVEFPYCKLSVLFDPMQERGRLNLAKNIPLLSESGSFSPDFLTYQWLLTAIIAKLFRRTFYICSAVSFGCGNSPSCDEIDLFINCAVNEIRKYNLWDLNIEHHVRSPTSTGRLFISASFSLPETPSDCAHSIIALHTENSVEMYFVPNNNNQNAISPPTSP